MQRDVTNVWELKNLGILEGMDNLWLGWVGAPLHPLMVSVRRDEVAMLDSLLVVGTIEWLSG